jgi:alanyl-tRNA synthetase
MTVTAPHNATFPSHRLRSAFLQFFKQHGHHVEQSAPLIPHDDPTLLFVNAGMVPFKNVFTQKEHRAYKRATSSQKCVRAGGKHNDLENVGQTARHHTFFEMLGNFSFGDYFKEEAITLAWKFLTEELKLDKSRLSVSIFAGDDQVPADIEAEKIWMEKIGLPADKIKRLGRADNFWQMGDTGPCGPCTEIHYDRRDDIVGFGTSDNDDRNIEIWNLVFMQYELLPDGTLKPLPALSVDTGMGLERLACVVNNLPSNYDTDLLRPLISIAEKLSKKTYNSSPSLDDMAMRVIADHARATAFLIADGLTPSNEGRGYVLRRIMRRAIRFGAYLGLNEPFFHSVALGVCDNMGAAYGELLEAKSLIEKVVFQEEESFRKTLERGLALFNTQTSMLKAGDELSGETVFKLHDTYGFPPDLTEDLAKARNLVINWAEFEAAQQAHEQKSGSGLGLKGIEDIFLSLAERLGKTEFLDATPEAELVAEILLCENLEVKELSQGQTGFLIAPKSCFYAESGGQVGDTGIIKADDFEAQVTDTKKIAGLTLHSIIIKHGILKLGQKLKAYVDWPRRLAIQRNHSATHLLHSALRQVLGTHVVQKGSLVAPERLRFDFAHFEAMNAAQLQEVENLVNNWILANEKAVIHTMSMEQAKIHGALALFGEKYEKQVRVLDMGSHSIELCGGTHCSRTGDIGSFRIVSEGPLAQGIRRLEAVTGLGALNFSRQNDNIIKELAKKLDSTKEDLPRRLDQVIVQLKNAEQALKSNIADVIKDRAQKTATHAQSIGKASFVSEIINDFDNLEDLRLYADFIRSALGSGVVALALKQGHHKCLILVAATKDLASNIHAGKIIAQIAPIIGGKGGGRPDFAQAGGNNFGKAAQALKQIEMLVRESLEK